MLIALAARVDAAPDQAAIAEAMRYADILTGVDREDVESDAGDDDNDDDDGDDDGIDDDEDAGDAGSDGVVTGSYEAAEEGPAIGAAGDGDGDGDDDGDGDLGAPASFAGVAMLDADLSDPEATFGGEASLGNAAAGAAETYESWMRHRRPSPWGRLDVGVEWRRRTSEPMHAAPHRYDEVWLLATWRR